MKTLMALRKLRLTVVSVPLLCVLGTVCFWLATSQAKPQTKQLQEKQVDSQIEEDQDRLIEIVSFRNEPVRIAEVKSKKGALKTGVKFRDADDWFTGLRIKIQNTSGKPVNYVSALVTFTRPKEQKEAGRIPFGAPLTYGTSPLEIKKSGSANSAPSIPPDENIELSLAETDVDEYKTLLKRLDFPDAITRIEIMLQEVGFEDGLLWSGGEYRGVVTPPQRAYRK